MLSGRKFLSTKIQHNPVYVSGSESSPVLRKVVDFFSLFPQTTF